ncbi:MAG: ABC transporter permease [Gammaproteobacteria bacterium]|nr:ABC transporter permease [Gammaproteobacteria bacterium]
MIDIDKWQEIYLTIKQHKVRTGLTAFGVFWGIFMLVALLGAGKGLERGVMNGFGDVTNVVFFWVGNASQLPYKGLSKGRTIHYTDDDIEAIRSRIKDIDLVKDLNGLGNYGSAQYIVRGEKSGSFSVRGSHENMAPMHQVRVIKGRYINKRDIDDKRKIAIIGTRVEELLFEQNEDPIGKSLNIYGVHFQVVGVVKPRSSGDNAQRDAEVIFIPNSTLRYAFNQTDTVGTIVLRPKHGVHANIVQPQVEKLLMERHKIHPSDAGVVSSFNLQEQYDKVQGLFTGITFFSWLVAIGTIMAGAIGVGNIMLIVVKERTREIGLRKALGATPISIVVMIVQESVVLTTVAGYIGLFLGVLLLESVTMLMEKMGMGDGIFSKPEIDFGTAMVAVIVLVISGILAAALPAAKAAGVDPILALQDE